MRTLVVFLLASVAGASPLSDGLERGKCDNGPGAEGADSYFVGSLAIGETAVEGTETWVVLANQKWIAKGGSDCELEWSVEGTKTSEVGMCVDCDYAIKLSATPQSSSSTCPKELVSGRKSPSGEMVGGEGTPWTETYAVKVEGEQAWIYFAKSGRKLTTGSFNDGTLSYTTNHQCKWF